jgi:hypothetical protein
MAAMPVRPGIEQVGRRHDWRACAGGMRPNRQLADYVVLVRPFGVGQPARDAGDDRQGSQVDEDVPRVAQDDRVVATQAVLRRHLDRRTYGALGHPNP